MSRVYNDILYTDADCFFKDIRHIEPRDDWGVFINSEEIVEILTDLNSAGSWYIEPEAPDDMTIDNWLLNGSEVFHLHPELGLVSDYMETGYVIAEVWDKKCILCGDEVKGEYDMINKFYQL